jgi:hypothetical protein
VYKSTQGGIFIVKKEVELSDIIKKGVVGE